MKNKVLKRITAVLLLFGLLISYLPKQAYAKTETKKDYEAYMESVFNRYENYVENTNYNYLKLTNGENYVCNSWAEEMEGKNWLEKSILYATHALTDKKLTEKEYAQYLSEMMVLMERGFVETVANQTNYEVKRAGITQYAGFVAKSAVSILGEGFVSELETTMAHYALTEKACKLLDLNTQMIDSVNQAIALMMYSEVYKKEVAVLKAIKENTEDKKLKKAAENLLDVAAAKFGCFAYMYLKEGVSTLTEFVWDFDNPQGTKLLTGIVKAVSNSFLAYLKKAGSNTAVFAFAENACAKFVVAADVACLVMVGFEIGGGLGNLFFGDQLDCYRRAFAYNQISKALSMAVSTKADSGMKGSGQKRYDSIFDIAACAEALVFSRMCGEEAIVNSVRESGGAKKEDCDNYLEQQRILLGLCSREIDAIFKELPPQVVVAANYSYRTENKASVQLIDPTITVVGNEEVTKKIAGNKGLLDLVDGLEKDIEMVKNVDRGSITAYLKEAYAVRGAISLLFYESVYTGGARPFSGSTSICFSLSNGDELMFDDLLDDNNDKAFEQFAKAFEDAAKAQYSNNGELKRLDWQEIIRSYHKGGRLDRIFCFSQNGIRISFSPDEIASHAAGFVEPVVPYESLHGIIKNQYLPISLNIAGGDITIKNSAEVEEDEVMHMPNAKAYGDKSVHAAIIDGAIYHASWYLESNSWQKSSNGSTSRIKYMTYYFNYMTNADVLWLPDRGDENHYVVDYGVFPMDSVKMKNKTLFIKTKNAQVETFY